MTNHPPKERILINLPSGKQYLGEDAYTTQASQKGLTCWYYSLNLLRPRIGKKLEHLIQTSLNSEDQVAEAAELLAIRKTEKAISEYRENTTRWYLLRNGLARYLKNLDKSAIEKTYESCRQFRQNDNHKIPPELGRLIEILNEYNSDPQYDNLEQVMSLLKEFTSQNIYTNFTQYFHTIYRSTS